MNKPMTLRNANREKAEGRKQKAKGRRQKAVGRKQKAEGRKQKAVGSRERILFVLAAFRLPPSAFCSFHSAIGRRFLLLCLLMSLAITAHGQEQQSSTNVKTSEGSSATGTISGRVVSGDDGRPLQNVVVSFYRVYATRPGPPQSVGTDSDGKFQMDELQDGLYTVYTDLPGYVMAESASAEPKYYRPGDSVTLTLIKGGVITGTVRDASNEPVISVPVRLSRVRDAMGRTLTTGFNSAQPHWTDDRGIYRFYGLQPGTYIVAAGGGLSRGFSLVNAYETDAPTYFPSSTRDTAAEVTVHAGEEATGTDIHYRGERGHAISGFISGAFDMGNPFGISITLAQASNGASEAMTFISPNLMKAGFSFMGVADGEYELYAQQGSSAGESVVSAPRRVTVKGGDVTGVELSLMPLASISGHLFLEAAPKEGCADKSGAKLIEMVVNARRDVKTAAQNDKSPQASHTQIFSAGGSIPDFQGEFTIRNLMGGSYRLSVRLPSEGWYVRFIALQPGAQPTARTQTAPTKSAETKSATTTAPVLMLKTGERVTGVTVQIAQDAATLRGRVVTSTAGTLLPTNLKVYLVPQERERADDVLRYSEASVSGDGKFSLTNLAPGHYFIIARPAPESDSQERIQRPLFWDAETRGKLRREAEATKTLIELQPCQRMTDYSLSYATP